MPTGATKVVLTDSTVLDFSSSKVSQTSAECDSGRQCGSTDTGGYTAIGSEW